MCSAKEGYIKDWEEGKWETFQYLLSFLKIIRNGCDASLSFLSFQNREDGQINVDSLSWFEENCHVGCDTV